ncbi:protein odr-4 homolog [Anopheles maculipalpis]|uniref:protein odr-4 homolog n=1 Tax=Anopheles maculipalpis TaxID=1496333 RepID=UPI0021596ACA|nr:protein odr-4 homolog [Anopheles maculipalpis]
MGRSVLCESFVEDYLRQLSRKAGVCMGLLIGQPSASGKDYIVHACRITGQDAEESDETQKLNATVASQQALDATRMLPGGMYVMGIFVIHPKNVFQDQTLLSSVKFILMSIKATFDANPLLMGTCDELEKNEKLVLYYSSSSSKTQICKTVSLTAENPAVLPCDWKFVERSSSWHKLNVYFETDEVYPLTQKSDHEQYDTEANLTECARKLKEQLMDAKILFGGEPKCATDTVEPAPANVYLPTSTELTPNETKIEHFKGTMKFDGIVSSQIFIHSQSTFGEAERFIVADIVRSLMSRIQIHCDSLVQTEDTTTQDKITLNELPRRIYFPVRAQGGFPVQFSDYLFPEESVETPVGRIREILDIGVAVRDLNCKVELVPVVKEDERPAEEEEVWRPKNKEEDFEGKLNLPVVGGLVTVIVLLIALLVYYLMK